jgi:Ser/Thr protein kinase RdoA (MazF antagonist)
MTGSSLVVSFVLETFGLAGPCSVGSLPSYDDENFLLSSPGWPHRLVFKLFNKTWPREALASQLAVLEHISQWSEANPELARGLPLCPAPLAGRRGAGDAEGSRLLRFSDGERWCACVLFIEGQVLAKTPITLPLCLDFGGRMGCLDRCLMAMKQPPPAGLVRPGFEWDSANALEVVGKFKGYIQDPEVLRLVEAVGAAFERAVSPVWAQLRRAVIHGDANTLNAVTDGAERLTGVIDFGDCMVTALVCEPAISLAYLMLDTADPVEVARAFVAGYQAQVPLTDLELEVLLPIALMRNCVSIVKGLEAAHREPQNRDYILVHQQSNIALLRHMDKRGFKVDFLI